MTHTEYHSLGSKCSRVVLWAQIWHKKGTIESWLQTQETKENLLSNSGRVYSERENSYILRPWQINTKMWEHCVSCVHVWVKGEMRALPCVHRNHKHKLKNQTEIRQCEDFQTGVEKCQTFPPPRTIDHLSAFPTSASRPLIKSVASGSFCISELQDCLESTEWDLSAHEAPAGFTRRHWEISFVCCYCNDKANDKGNGPWQLHRYAEWNNKDNKDEDEQLLVINSHQVKWALRWMNTNKAAGADGVPGHVLTASLWPRTVFMSIINIALEVAGHAN